MRGYSYCVKMPEARVVLYVVILAMSSPFFLGHEFSIAGAQRTDPSEVNALRVIRSKLIDPMKKLDTWYSGDPCRSNWTGISCDAVSNDRYLHIREFQLLKLNLSGSLAAELGLLSHLKIFFHSLQGCYVEQYKWKHPKGDRKYHIFEAFMLVYEFMPNGTLRDHLSANSVAPLDFSVRLHIALGSSKGILYLHTEADPPIFHRDIKASNILLDSNFNAKVADFGLSRLAPVPDSEGTIPNYVSTLVKGTPGYLDPEYFLTHKLTEKSDVYSIGIVFLELLTGMRPISHGKNIVREVSMARQSGMMLVIDKNMGSYSPECIKKFASLALKCCEDQPDARPSMSEVVAKLESIRKMTPEADAAPLESMVTSPDKLAKSSSTSSGMDNPFISFDTSGTSNADRGLASTTVTPR